MTSFPILQRYDNTAGLSVQTGELLPDGANNRFFAFKNGNRNSATAGVYRFDIATGAQTGVLYASSMFAGDSSAYASIASPVTLTFGGSILLLTSIGNAGGSNSYRLVDATSMTMTAQYGGSPVFELTGGFCPLSAGGIDFVLQVGPGSGAFESVMFEAHGSVLQFAGHRFATDEGSLATQIQGIPTTAGTGISYSIAYNTNATRQVGIYKTVLTSSAAGYNVALWPGTPNSHITTTKVGVILATAIDAGWTTGGFEASSGMYDQSDGNIVFMAAGIGGSSTQYLVKASTTDASIVWTLALDSNFVFGGDVGTTSLNGTLWLVRGGGSSDTIYEFDTTAGTLTTSTAFSATNGLTDSLPIWDATTLSVFTKNSFSGTSTPPPYPAPGTAPNMSSEWARYIVSSPPSPPVTVPYYIERMAPVFDDNIPDNEHFTVDSGIVPPSARLATLSPDGFDGIRCYGMDQVTNLGATTLAGVLGGMDIGDSIAASSGTVDFAFNTTFTLAYVQSFGTTTKPQVYFDHYQVAIDSGTQDGNGNQLYYVIPFMVGFPYTSQGQLLRPNHGADAGARAGPAMGKIRRNHKYAALLYRTQGDLKFGTDFGNSLRLTYFKAWTDDTAITSPTLFSGTVKTTIDDDYSLDGMISFQMTRPGPCTLVSIAGYVEAQDE